jgi:hypothetical protein
MRCSEWMTRLVRGLIAGALMASIGGTSVWSEAEYCVAVADDQTGCPRVPEPNLTVTTTDQDLAVAPAELAPAELAPAELAPADQTTTVTTRTLGPPVVVQGFGGVAAPQSAAVEQPLVRTQLADQKLPPGPPSRLP